MVAAAVLPGAIVLGLGFSSGGFFPGTTAIAAILLAGVIVARVILAPDPFEGMSVQVGVAAGALSLYALWTLISAAWSDAPARALVESDRALLYLLAIVLFGSFVRTSSRLRWLVRGLALGIVVVCIGGLVSRIVPELWSGSAPVHPDRLSYPLGYWNALGAAAGIGIILCFYLTTSLREHLAVRAAGAASIAVLVPTLILTFSRGALAACLAGLVAYAVFGRPHGLPAGLLAVLPTTGLAAIATYRAGDVTNGRTTSAAVEQGHDLALLIMACATLALVLRALLARLDRSAPLLRSARTRTMAGRTACVAAVVAAAAWLATGGTGVLERQYDRFLVNGGVGQSETRDRLTEVGNNGRTELWKAALEGFQDDRLLGEGAGTFPNLWNLDRPSKTDTTEGHSVYIETLGELGLVGFLLLATCLTTIFLGVLLRMRGPDRAVYAALCGAMVAWGLHAGVNWLWEVPAVTIWLFCAGGAVLASSTASARPAPRRLIWRGATVAGLLVLVVTPALIGLSQVYLDDGIQAFKDDDCPTAVDASLDSISVLDVRPEPYEVIGYCDARKGLTRPAIEAFEAAIHSDRENWRLHYGLAIARASGGLDPRPAAARALALNPQNETAMETAAAFATDSPGVWRLQARKVPLPFPP